jgi:D-threo-aldose 1-dehydrogenase
VSSTGLPERTFTTRGGKLLRFTTLGLGTAPLGNMHRALPEDDARETLEAAWNAGIRYFDTAPLYGHGLSEMRLGRLLRDKPRRDFLLSTKVGRLLEPCRPEEADSGIYKATPPFRIRYDYSYDGVMRSYEASLVRLGVDRIDILFVHDVDARTHGGRTQSEARIRELVDDGGWRALDDLRRSGAIAAIGAGVNEWEPCARLLALADPDLFLLAGRYTLLEQEPLDTLFPQCVARGVGIVVGGPFNSGVLAGQASYDYGTVPAEIAARVRQLAEACREYDVPLPQAALQFVLAHPTVVCVIPGGQTKAEVVANVRLAQATTPADLWHDLTSRGLISARAPTPEAVAC